MKPGALAETGLTFDDILGAVQESSRGRWFLDEFQKRQEDKGSAKILAAITKIENRIESMAHVNEPQGELTRLRTAIATARREIALQESGSNELSAEGRMFAKLAEMARKTLPAASMTEAAGTLTSSVVRALTLIDEIDVTLNTPVSASAPAAPQSAPSAENLFKADAALFEAPAKPARPILVTVPARPPQAKPAPEATMAGAAKDEEPKRGAKLVINRVAVTEAEPVQAHVREPAPVVNEAPETVQTMENATVDMPAPPTIHVAAKAEPAKVEVKTTPRIVIVRRKPEDMQSVPLTEPASESAA